MLNDCDKHSQLAGRFVLHTRVQACVVVAANGFPVDRRLFLFPVANPRNFWLSTNHGNNNNLGSEKQQQQQQNNHSNNKNSAAFRSDLDTYVKHKILWIMTMNFDPRCWVQEISYLTLFFLAFCSHRTQQFLWQCEPTMWKKLLNNVHMVKKIITIVVRILWVFFFCIFALKFHFISPIFATSRVHGDQCRGRAELRLCAETWDKKIFYYARKE